MAVNRSIAPPPQQDQDIICLKGSCHHVSIHRHEVIIESTALVVMSSLVLTFIIIVTQNRLWYSSKFLRLFLDHMEQPLSSLINSGFLLVMGFPYPNHLYTVWAVLLLVGTQSLQCVSGYSLQNSPAMKTLYLQSLLYNVLLGVIIGVLALDSVFRDAIWALWVLTTLKLIQRFISLLIAEKKYSTEKVNLISDHMKTEHTMDDENFNPVSMKGYKYIVFGEDQVNTEEIKPPEYRMSLDLNNPLVVTTEQIWAKKEGILSPELDPDSTIKDLCLSFALFKLLTRRFLNYPAAEARQPKTREFVFDGLLSSKDKERPFRIIRTELGFYKDLLFTKHPIIFSKGIPVFNYILTFLTIGISCWIAKIAYHDYKPKQFDTDEVLNITKTGRNIDLYVTYILVGLIIAMEVIEFLTYVLSDWARVMFVRMYLNKPWLHFLPFLDKVFAVSSQRNVVQPLSNRLGQYSLFKRYKASGQARLHKLTCSVFGKKPGDGLSKDWSINLPSEVKFAVFDSLVVNQYRLSNGLSSLFRNGVSEQLSWACNPHSDLHTIMVWHVATSYCEMIPSKNSDEGDIESHKNVAIYLSKYCAYLVVILPDVLPGCGNAVRFVFNKIVQETREFFQGKNDKYQRMKQVGDRPENTIIAKGSQLGKKLEEMNVRERWKVLADFWAELIVYLAPSNNVAAHLYQLQFGGEFITHLWVLLYHSGIIEKPEEPAMNA